MFSQAWQALTAVLQRPPQTALLLSVDAHFEGVGQLLPGEEARTVIALAARHLIHLAHRHPVAHAELEEELEPRVLTPAGETNLSICPHCPLCGFGLGFWCLSISISFKPLTNTTKSLLQYLFID